MPTTSFFANGLRFRCTACGKCCQNHKGFDHVYLTLQDVGAIAKLLELPRTEFRQRYTRRKEGHVLLKTDGETCIFLQPNGHCKIYEARPLQCRTFPFWKENLNPQTWKEIEADCPGAGTGHRVPMKEIETYLAWDQCERYDEEV